MLEKPHKALVIMIFALIVSGYAVMAVYFPLAYIWATYEDLLGEWAQTYFFLAAAILSVLVALKPSRYRWFFAVLAVACSYVFLEEISWGQRIFGFSTPEFLKSRNLQGEANLHNIFTGPHNTLLKDFLSYGVALALVAYGLLYPVSRALRSDVLRWFDRIGIAAPPLLLWPFFALAAFLELKPLSFNEAEIAELLIAIALTITALQYRLALNNPVQAANFSWTRRSSLHFAKQTAIVCSAVVVLAVSTTAAFYLDSNKRSRIDGRIERGMEKFAGRYERYDRCDIAIELYTELLRREPERVFLWRKVAACYLDLERQADFKESLARAIKIDLRTHAKDPWRASVNQSLVRSYRLGGERDKARAHLEEALKIGQDRIDAKPDSAKAAYSFARSLKLAGRHSEALHYFTRAHEIKPTSSKYRKAYYSAMALARRQQQRAH